MRYTWECTGCKQIQIVERKVADIDKGPEDKCPICGNEHYERIIVSGGGFVLQGRGWFKKGGY